mmetsp:Transcript_11953/g.31646  ORF Transcript_11953/g.31646 Transcript_11953/m.31646 type:complete len:229 (-) Transcript_11953:55-741(-)
MCRTRPSHCSAHAPQIKESQAVGISSESSAASKSASLRPVSEASALATSGGGLSLPLGAAPLSASDATTARARASSVVLGTSLPCCCCFCCPPAIPSATSSSSSSRFMPGVASTISSSSSCCFSSSFSSVVVVSKHRAAVKTRANLRATLSPRVLLILFLHLPAITERARSDDAANRGKSPVSTEKEATLKADFKQTLDPPDPDQSKDDVVEPRGGTGEPSCTTGDIQ